MSVIRIKWQAAGLALAILLGGCFCPADRTTPATRPATAPARAGIFVNVRALIVVRHADVDLGVKKEEGDATPLLPRGEARTAELAFALRDSGITRIFTTQTVRTEKTAEAAGAGKIAVESPFAHRAGAQDVLAYLAEHTSETDVVLLVENHGTIRELLQAMGYRDETLINERTEFDRMYVILPDAATRTYRVLRVRYGGNWGQ
jgi:probable phosphoglycerate mutase